MSTAATANAPPYMPKTTNAAATGRNVIVRGGEVNGEPGAPPS